MVNTNKNKVVVSHYSALCLLRYARNVGAEILPCKQRNILKNSRVPRQHEVSLIRKLLQEQTNRDDKLEVLLFSKNRYKDIPNLTCHTCHLNLSATSFSVIKVPNPVLQEAIFDKILVTNIELTICNLTKTIPQWKILQWIMEFMGNYSINIKNETGFVNCSPLILNINSINECMHILSSTRLCNARNLSTILNYATRGSASPAETNLYILLCGPRKLGFYQITKMTLNREIKLSDEAKIICGQSCITPDLSMSSKKIAIEYDSRKYHENTAQGQKDKRRVAALEHDGWQIFTFVPYQMNNFAAFSQLAKDILKAAGQTSQIRTKNFEIINKQNYYHLLSK